jgi:AcrR family transcriptional regulator
MARSTRRGIETKARIASAATKLFCAQGYIDTTMAAIAAEAGVSVQTLYLRYGSKGAILSAALDVAIAGDAEPVEVMKREWVQRALAESDGPTAVSLWAQGARTIVDRTHVLFGVIQSAAADPEVAEVLAKSKRERVVAQRTFADVLSKQKGFNRAVSTERAADLLYGLMTEDSYLVFVVDRGWTADEWQSWAANTVIAQLFSELSGGPGHRAGQTFGQTSDDSPARTSTDRRATKPATTSRTTDQAGRRRTRKSPS